MAVHKSEGDRHEIMKRSSISRSRTTSSRQRVGAAPVEAQAGEQCITVGQQHAAAPHDALQAAPVDQQEVCGSGSSSAGGAQGFIRQILFPNRRASAHNWRQRRRQRQRRRTIGVGQGVGLAMAVLRPEGPNLVEPPQPLCSLPIKLKPRSLRQTRGSSSSGCREGGRGLRSKGQSWKCWLQGRGAGLSSIPALTSRSSRRASASCPPRCSLRCLAAQRPSSASSPSLNPTWASPCLHRR